MKGFRTKVVVGAIVLTVGGAATAAVAVERGSVQTKLVGYQEVPAISTDGSGTFRASINSTHDQITYELTYGGLSGTVQQAHIHFGQKDVSGGIAVFLCTNLGNGPAGTQPCPQEGTIRGTIRAADVIGPEAQGIAPGEFDELLRAAQAGMTYANIHTAPHPAGEIRAQIPGTRQH